MKIRTRPFAALAAALSLALPAGAAVIYSGFQNIDIPADYDGVYLNVENGAWNTNMFSPVSGWHINPFFGGSMVANSPDFQPVRSAAGRREPVLKLGEGAEVDGGTGFFSDFTWDDDSNPLTPGVPGYGGSQTHIGVGAGKFTAGAEGYLGFKLNGTDYGWMRVVFTDNTGAGKILDWAYEDSGLTGSIFTGNVRQTDETITVDSTYGDFTLGSFAIGSATAANNLVKEGANTVTIAEAKTYTGTTTVALGTLALGGTGSIAGSATIDVQDGATLDVTGIDGAAFIVGGTGTQELTGEGTLLAGGGGDKGITIGGQGRVAPGSGPGSPGTLVLAGDTAFSGGRLDLDLDGTNNIVGGSVNDLLDVQGDLTLDGILNVSEIHSFAGAAYGDSWTIITYSGGLLGPGLTLGTMPTAPAGMSFKIDTTTELGKVLLVIPEPSAALLLALGALPWLRRRRP